MAIKNFQCKNCEVIFGVTGYTLGSPSKICIPCPECSISLILEDDGSTEIMTLEEADELYAQAEAMGLLGYDSGDALANACSEGDSEQAMVSFFETVYLSEDFDDATLVDEIKNLEVQHGCQFSVNLSDSFTRYAVTGRLDSKSKKLLRNTYGLVYSYGLGSRAEGWRQ